VEKQGHSMLTEADLKTLEELKQRYQTTRALTLPALWMVQQNAGWISEDAMKEVAKVLGVPLSHIYGVVSFYTMFNRRPVGKHHLQVCTNVSCQLRGAEKLLNHICERLKVNIGETTSDRKFTVTEVECLGSCGTAPMMQVNDEYYEDLTMEKVDRLIDELGKR